MRTALLASFLAIAFAGAAAAEGGCAGMKNVTAQTTSTVQTAQAVLPGK